MSSVHSRRKKLSAPVAFKGMRYPSQTRLHHTDACFNFIYSAAKAIQASRPTSKPSKATSSCSKNTSSLSPNNPASSSSPTYTKSSSPVSARAWAPPPHAHLISKLSPRAVWSIYSPPLTRKSTSRPRHI